ncbi:hypothetical protein ACFWUU_10000 [Kribbella sp. NPDC058693]|uniref:hypothetical protein n=1 Tax=Kribbella sp. NPDC058693 TaxID=3346602 RepID=UPI00364D9A2A
MDVDEVLRTALRAVKDAQVPDDLKEIAFTKAIDILSGAGEMVERSTDKQDQEGDQGDGTATESDRLKKLADALSVPHERIEMIYVEHDGDLQVAADPGRLGNSTHKRAGAVGLLVAAGRQLGGWDEGPTSDNPIRAEIDRLGLYDNTNYSKHMKDLGAWFNINGIGRSATYKLKYPGREHLKTLAKELSEG